MKLFALKFRGRRIPNLYFPTKPLAKAQRDILNQQSPGYTVTPGPDHRRFK